MDYEKEIKQLKLSIGALETHITALNDTIKELVRKNDVINQINITDECILIDGSKLHITGQTTFDLGVSSKESEITPFQRVYKSTESTIVTSKN